MKTMAKFLFVATLTILLAACAQSPQAQTQSPTTQSRIKTGEHSLEQYTSDALITSKVKAKYLKLKLAGVSVSTNKGVVSLVGALPDQAAKDRAIAIAQNTKGVKSVDASNLTNIIKAMTLQTPPKQPIKHKKE